MGLVYIPRACEFDGDSVTRTDVAADPDTSALDPGHLGPVRERRFTIGSPGTRTEAFSLRGRGRASEAQALAEWRALQRGAARPR